MVLFNVSLYYRYFLFGLAISKYGTIRLGSEDGRPEFSFLTWISMLFSAGLGVGLVFWGVAEPMSHYFSPPFSDTKPLSTDAARLAMGYSFFHWGLSQWSVYAILGLVMAFVQFNKKKYAHLHCFRACHWNKSSR